MRKDYYNQFVLPRPPGLNAKIKNLSKMKTILNSYFNCNPQIFKLHLNLKI